MWGVGGGNATPVFLSSLFPRKKPCQCEDDCVLGGERAVPHEGLGDPGEKARKKVDERVKVDAPL